MTAGLAAGLQAGVSALPLLFGENSIFSGKKRQATRELEKGFKASQAYELPSEFRQAYESAQQQAGEGMGGAALGLYRQEAARSQQNLLSALGSKRSLLGGVGQVVQGGQDAALRLGKMESDIRGERQRYADTMGMQFGRLKQAEQMRKLDETAQYWGTRRAESDQSTSRALAGIGSAMGTYVASQGPASGLRNRQTEWSDTPYSKPRGY